MSEDKWIKTYFKVIDKLKRYRAVGPYNELKIVGNRPAPPHGWLFNRHHIDEIYTSGAKLMETPEYQTGECIVVNYTEHYLLHYIIVMAQTTFPNHGMLMNPIKVNYTITQAIDLWEEQIKIGCEKFNVEFDENWRKILTYKRKEKRK
ncbi:MAG: hypothetical protein WBL58_03005 [Peptococcia bacterium]